MSLVEALPQVMAPLDPEMAALLHLELKKQGVELHLNDPVTAFETPSQAADAQASVVVLRSGRRLAADLVVLELAYAPPFSSAKDPANLAGMVAQNVLARDVRMAQWSELSNLDASRTVLLDVRSDEEWRNGHIPGSVRLPLPQLRARLSELPKDKEITVYCTSGQRSYYACRILSQQGFRTRNLSGSYETWKAATA